MRLLISSAILIFCFSAIGQEKPAREIKGSKFIQYLLVGDTSGRKGVFDSAVTEIYSSGNIFLYDLSYRYITSHNEIELVSEERHHYFIHSKDSVYGYDYNGYKKPYVKRLKTDSILRRAIGTRKELEDLFSLTETKLLASKYNADSGTAHETYTIWTKGNESQPSTCFLDYTNLPIALQSNPLLNAGKIKDMNLCKVRILSECYPCNFDLTYSVENIKTIKENIALIFDEYFEKRSGVFRSSGGYTTIGY
ncbi:MAG: hypothetical protein ABI581_07520 [Sediminibacterium sp.]